MLEKHHEKMNDNFKDLLSENGEILLDTLITNEIIKEIPILGNSLKIIRGVQSIRDRAYLNKIKNFIKNINKFDISQKLRLIEESKKDEKSRVKFGDALFTAIEQSDSLVKIEYLAIAFEAFSNGDFESSDLRLICHIIKNSFTDELIDVVENDYPTDLQFVVASGLAEMEFRELTADMTNTEPKYHLSYPSKVLRTAWRKYKKES